MQSLLKCREKIDVCVLLKQIFTCNTSGFVKCLTSTQIINRKSFVNI